MLRILIKIALFGALAALLTVMVADAVAADETPPDPIDTGDETDTDDIPDDTEYVHSMTDDVRIVDYAETDDGELEVIIDADTDATGSFTDDGVTGGGELPPVQDLHLNEGRNTITVDVEDRPIVTFTVDGERYMADEDDSEIVTETEQDRSIAAVFVSGLVIFASGASAGLAIRKIRKEKVKVIK